jgi:hypothetical protein
VEPAGAVRHDDPTADGNEELQAWLFPAEITTGRTTTKNFFANIAGTIVTLPAGDLGFAFGVESRKEEASTPRMPWPRPAPPPTWPQARPVAATRSTGLPGVNVPVLADLPGAKELTFNGATRFSDYDTFGNTLNSKFGFKWKPIDRCWSVVPGPKASVPDHQRPVRWWFADLRAVQRSVRHRVRLLGLQR